MNRVVEFPVVFTNEGMQLVGMVHRPENKAHPPAVVFFHGCTTTRNEAHELFVKVARALAGHGIMAFRFDFRNNGESEGEFARMTLSGEVSDGIRAVDVLVREYGADPSRIGIVAMSMGGAIGAIVAGRLGERIASCALLNPVGRPLDDLSSIARFNSLDTTGYPIVFRTFLFGEEFARDLPSIQPLGEIGAATCPVLVVSGTGDTTIDPKRSREYVDTIRSGGGKAELHEIIGADHLFSSIPWQQEVIDTLSGWFSRTLDGHVL